METIDLETFVDGCHGRPFREFVHHHQQRQTREQRTVALAGMEEHLPPPLSVYAQEMAPLHAEDPAQMERDCGDVAEDFFRTTRVRFPMITDLQAFDLFTYVTMYVAQRQPERRRNIAPAVVMVIAGLVLANVTDSALLLVVAFVIGGLGLRQLLTGSDRF